MGRTNNFQSLLYSIRYTKTLKKKKKNKKYKKKVDHRKTTQPTTLQKFEVIWVVEYEQTVKNPEFWRQIGHCSGENINVVLMRRKEVGRTSEEDADIV